MFRTILRQAIRYSNISLVRYFDCPNYRRIFKDNYVFIFDKAMYLELKNGGINTVYYLPMMAAADRLDNLVVPESAVDTISSDVSFVGSMYNEKHNLYDRMYENLDTYARGYLDGIIEAQLKVWGISFADKLLTDKIIECMYKSMPY